MPPREKVGTVATLIAIGLLGALVVKLPSRTLSFAGSSFVVTGRLLLGLVLLGLACTGVQNVVYGHPKGKSLGLVESFLHWVLPAAWLIVLFAFVIGPGSMERRMVGALVGSTLLGVLIIAEYYVTDADGRWTPVVRLLLQFVTYLVAVALYLVLLRYMPSGAGHLLATGVIAVTLGVYLLAPVVEPSSVARYLLGLGAFIAFACWMVGRLWDGPALAYALVFVVLLYVATGLAKHFFLNKLTWPVTLEYAAAGLLILTLLLAYAS